MCTNLHQEADEADVMDKFSDYGPVKNLHMNLERRTGFIKGYALIEFETRAEAEAAIQGISGTQLLEQTLQCDFAFVRPPVTESVFILIFSIFNPKLTTKCNQTKGTATEQRA